MSVSRVSFGGCIFSYILVDLSSDSMLRILQLYLTDLTTRESLLLCTEEHPILQMVLQDDSIWIATTDSSLHRWPCEGRNPQKALQRGGSFLAGNLSFSRARVSLEGSSLVCDALIFFMQLVS